MSAILEFWLTLVVLEYLKASSMMYKRQFLIPEIWTPRFTKRFCQRPFKIPTFFGLWHQVCMIFCWVPPNRRFCVMNRIIGSDLGKMCNILGNLLFSQSKKKIPVLHHFVKICFMSLKHLFIAWMWPFTVLDYQNLISTQFVYNVSSLYRVSSSSELQFNTK